MPKKNLVILGIPLVEFIALRVAFHSFLGLRIAIQIWTPDYDLIPPTIVSVLLLLAISDRAESLNLSLQKRFFGLHVTLLAFFLCFTLIFKASLSGQNLAFVSFWFCLFGATLASALFILLSPHYLFKRGRRILIFPAVALALSGLFARTVLNSLWEPLARITGVMVYWTLRLMVGPLKYQLRQAFRSTHHDEYTLLTHPFFGIAIGRGCGGMEGIILFIFVLLLLCASYWKRFPPLRWGMLFAAGIIYMFFLNFARICLFFLISLCAVKIWGNRAGVMTASMLFHNALGWILEGSGLVIFFHAAFRRGTAIRERRLVERFQIDCAVPAEQ